MSASGAVKCDNCGRRVYYRTCGVHTFMEDVSLLSYRLYVETFLKAIQSCSYCGEDRFHIEGPL